MDQKPARPQLIFIVGPTATGKTELSLEIAEQIGAEILNCDSVQVYRAVDVGTAKPSREQMERVPHHLIGFVPEGETYTAGQFRRDALEVIRERFLKGVQRFLVVGGSGFYVQALEKGMYPVPETDPRVRQELEKDIEDRRLSELYQELEELDPEYAYKISPNDRYRIFRALEILRSHVGLTMGEIRKRFQEQSSLEKPWFDTLKIGLALDRAVLRDRVENRTIRMLRRGLLEEVIGLRERGFGAWWPMSSVGYKEIQGYLDGELKEEEVGPAIVTSTMQLAKRQMTWFRRDSGIHWFDAQAGSEAPLELVDAFLREPERYSNRVGPADEDPGE